MWTLPTKHLDHFPRIPRGFSTSIWGKRTQGGQQKCWHSLGVGCPIQWEIEWDYWTGTRMIRMGICIGSLWPLFLRFFCWRTKHFPSAWNDWNSFDAVYLCLFVVGGVFRIASAFLAVVDFVCWNFWVASRISSHLPNHLPSTTLSPYSPWICGITHPQLTCA